MRGFGGAKTEHDTEENTMMILNRFKAEEPEGFVLPKSASDLLTTAALAGWATGWRWDEDSGGSPFVTIHVADQNTGERFQVTWHSRNTGSLRLFSKMHQPVGKEVWKDAPSLKVIGNRIQAAADQNS